MNDKKMTLHLYTIKYSDKEIEEYLCFQEEFQSSMIDRFLCGYNSNRCAIIKNKLTAWNSRFNNYDSIIEEKEDHSILRYTGLRDILITDDGCTINAFVPLNIFG